MTLIEELYKRRPDWHWKLSKHINFDTDAWRLGWRDETGEKSITVRGIDMEDVRIEPLLALVENSNPKGV